MSWYGSNVDWYRSRKNPTGCISAPQPSFDLYLYLRSTEDEMMNIHQFCSWFKLRRIFGATVAPITLRSSSILKYCFSIDPHDDKNNSTKTAHQYKSTITDMEFPDVVVDYNAVNALSPGNKDCNDDFTEYFQKSETIESEGKGMLDVLFEKNTADFVLLMYRAEQY